MSAGAESVLVTGADGFVGGWLTHALVAAGYSVVAIRRNGSATSTAAALAPGNVHNVTLDTTSVGGHSGTINVNSSSEAVANGSFFTGATTSERPFSSARRSKRGKR